MLVLDMKLPLNCEGVILLDAAILLPEPHPASLVLARLFQKYAEMKVDTWPSKKDAHEYVSKTFPYKTWDKDAILLFAVSHSSVTMINYLLILLLLEQCPP
jgi:hypothetical protein